MSSRSEHGTQPGAAARVPAALRVGIAVAALAAGGLFAIGAALAILFELQGFGVPGDGQTRPGRVLGYVVGLVVSLTAPVVVLRLLFPRRVRWWWAAVATAVAVAVAAIMLGLGS